MAKTLHDTLCGRYIAMVAWGRYMNFYKIRLKDLKDITLRAGELTDDRKN
jgi:hypothetical protein